MSAEFTEILLEDDTSEIIEENYIVEEIDESVYENPIKEENETGINESYTFPVGEEYAHIACLGKEEDTNQDVYHCAPCNVTFTSIEDHLTEYHEYQSTEGEEYVESNQVVKSELKEEATDIVCQSCDQTFETMIDAEIHQCQGDQSSQSLMCNNCQSIFDSETDFEAHSCMEEVEVKDETPKAVYACSQCPEKFEFITTLQQHQKTHKAKRSPVKKVKKAKPDDTADASEKTHHCDICNTTFTSAKNLKLHAKMHLTIPTKTIKDAMPIGAVAGSEKDQFYCEICNKSFDHDLLEIHRNMHQNVEEHNCSICNRQFENQVSYDMHMQLHAYQPTRTRPQLNPRPGARFACNFCGREFLRPHEKVKHERIHTGEKPHECEVCGKCFRVSYSLTLHLRTHTDVRPFVCAQCNKRFKAYAVYSHHLNTHSEDRPYKCPMCPKSFRTSVQLCGHKNSHTKPYNCPECNRPFASLYAVKMHMKTHNKSSKSNENLKHRCGICGAVYARMFALRFHMKEQHSTELTEDQQKDLNDDKQPPITADDCFNEDEVSTQAILQGEEIIIDNFHTEEIVTDWLTSK